MGALTPLPPAFSRGHRRQGAHALGKAPEGEGGAPRLFRRLSSKEKLSFFLVTPLPLGEGPGVRANGAKVYPPRFCWPFRLNLMTLPPRGGGREAAGE